MCIILDANVAGNIAGDKPTTASKLVIDWITYHGGRIVRGGKLTEELNKVKTARRWLANLQRAGRLLTADEKQVNQRTRELIAEKACKSNDPHIIALAQISGARVLYSLDQGLHGDFRNPALVALPRGKIFQNAHHGHLISKHLCAERGC